MLLQSMKFLDPKSDIVFKKIFDQHPHLIKSLKLFNRVSSSETEDQQHLERTVTGLATLSQQCEATRGKFISDMPQTPNPFESKIAQAVKIRSGFPYRTFDERKEGPPLNPIYETAVGSLFVSFAKKN